MAEVKGKRVLVVGLARTGRAVAQVLRRRGASVTVTDLKPPSAFQDVLPELMAEKIGVELGVQREETFLHQDLIVVSPGVPWDLPLLQAARKRNISIVPEIEVAGWFLAGRLVGITGTNGKTTTTALLGRMLEASGFSAFVGGNIGVPLISAVDHVSPESMVVAELSSFQLEGIQDFHPRVAVLLNLTPNHLDRHTSFDLYTRAKAQIFRNQTADDCAVLNADDARVMGFVPAITERGIRKIFFSRRQDLPEGVLVLDGRVCYRVGNLERVLFGTRDVTLRGDFNLENVLAASAAACVLGADFEAIARAAREFKGVEHRLEFVGKIRGVGFYNDSKATSVDATSKALSVFERGVHLILGGKDKGAPYAPLRPLMESRVRAVYLIGAAAERIEKELSGAPGLFRAGDLETAVREASRRAQAGDVVLLSPACSSFDQFQDFEHRGRVFKEIVARLAQEAENSGSGIQNSGFVSKGAALGTEENGSGIEQPNSKPQTPNPESRALTPDPRPPSPESRSPKAELVYIYEVGAEEFSPGEEIEVSAEEEPAMAASEDAFKPEILVDEPLPFEIRARAPSRGGTDEPKLAVSAAPSEGGSGPKARGAAADDAPRERPVVEPGVQRRLPGLK